MSAPKYSPILIPHDLIRDRAFYLSQLQKTYDQLIWDLAEITLRLEQGLTPSPELIRDLAHQFAGQNPPLEMVHWLIAERELIFEQKFAIQKPL